MIKKYSLLALQKAINTALSLDENSAAKLAALEGRILQIIIAPLNVSFFISFADSQLQLDESAVREPDTIIRSNPLGLIRLSLLPASKARSLFNDRIQLSGDVELGEKVKKLFDELDIDWEGHLAHFTGDVAAFQLGSLVRRGKAFAGHFSQTMQHSLREFLEDEQHLLPGREEMEDFFKDVEDLRHGTERLEAWINHLKADHETC